MKGFSYRVNAQLKKVLINDLIWNNFLHLKIVIMTPTPLFSYPFIGYVEKSVFEKKREKTLETSKAFLKKLFL